MKYVLVGLLAASVACGVVFFFLAAPQDEVAPPDAQTEEIALLRQQLEQSEAGRIQLQKDASLSAERIEKLEEEATEAETLAGELSQVAAEASQVSEESTPQDEVKDDETKRKDSLEEIVAKLSGNPQASAQIQGLTELLYADFLKNIDVDADTKAELRKFLRESYLETLALSQYAMRNGEVPWSEFADWQAEEREFLDEQLQALLSDDDYASWSDYVADIDARQLESQLRNQIGAFASGLTPGNFDAVMQIAVDEFRAQQIALEQSNTLYTLSENIYYQIRAMNAMREQLMAFLPADQMAEIENWLTMGENTLTAQLPQDAVN